MIDKNFFLNILSKNALTANFHLILALLYLTQTFFQTGLKTQESEYQYSHAHRESLFNMKANTTTFFQREGVGLKVIIGKLRNIIFNKNNCGCFPLFVENVGDGRILFSRWRLNFCRHLLFFAQKNRFLYYISTSSYGTVVQHCIYLLIEIIYHF